MGDYWVFVSKILKKNAGEDVKIQTSKVDLVSEMVDLFDHKCNSVEITEKRGPSSKMLRPRRMCIAAREPRLKTKKRWEGGNLIAYSTGCRYRRKFKTPPWISEMTETLKSIGAIDVGLPMSLTEAVDVMSKCKFYIGVPNGLTHICESLECPTHIVIHNFGFEGLVPDLKYGKIHSIQELNNLLGLSG